MSYRGSIAGESCCRVYICFIKKIWGLLMDNKILLIILALLIPPLAVYLKKNEVGKDLIINIVLCFFFWVPAIVHALWVVLS